MKMSLRGKKVTVHDMTLRDGMHPKRHLMTLEQMIDIATGLDEAGVPLIEVTHGDGLGGFVGQLRLPGPQRRGIPRRRDSENEAGQGLGAAAARHRYRRSSEDGARLGVHTIRVATHCTEADVSEQHITMASKLDMDTVGFLMMAT
jgi:4-hydroxy-2-oxovalerate/4-hydroxy-2-oxohexanoate aldolase